MHVFFSGTVGNHVKFSQIYHFHDGKFLIEYNDDGFAATIIPLLATESTTKPMLKDQSYFKSQYEIAKYL